MPTKEQTKMQTEAELELAGRMYECCDIEKAIQSGQFKTLDDVLEHVTERSSSINSVLFGNAEKPIM